CYGIMPGDSAVLFVPRPLVEREKPGGYVAGDRASPSGDPRLKTPKVLDTLGNEQLGVDNGPKFSQEPQTVDRFLVDAVDKIGDLARRQIHDILIIKLSFGSDHRRRVRGHTSGRTTVLMDRTTYLAKQICDCLGLKPYKVTLRYNQI